MGCIETGQFATIKSNIDWFYFCHAIDKRTVSFMDFYRKANEINFRLFDAVGMKLSNSLCVNIFKCKFHPIQSTSEVCFWKVATTTRWESHQMMMLVDFYRWLFLDSDSIIPQQYRANDFANGKKWRNFYSCFGILNVFDDVWLTVRHLLGRFMSESIH